MFFENIVILWVGQKLLLFNQGCLVSRFNWLFSIDLDVSVVVRVILVWLQIVLVVCMHVSSFLCLLLLLLENLKRSLFGPVFLFLFYFSLILQLYLFRLQRLEAIDWYFYYFLKVRRWFLCQRACFVQKYIVLVILVFINIMIRVNVVIYFTFYRLQSTGSD